MLICLKELSHTYKPGTPFAARALAEVNLNIPRGQFVGLIGPTGSGKSTLVQHLNGLLKATSGQVMVDGQDLAARETRLKEIRQRVGLVFQYPEHQLFEETVARDVAFGPRNMGMPEDVALQRAEEAVKAVGLDYQALKDRSPFSLSGGQKRRVAIAGVLAMHPQVLVLDEPTAGLDPRGRTELLDMVADLHKQKGLTVILVTHSMEDVARLADRCVVMHRGRVVMDGSPREVFARGAELRQLGLDVPPTVQLMEQLRARGLAVPAVALTLAEARDAILRAVKGGGRAV